ncbi:topoisomerase II-associated protein PAT1 [Trichophaea hybrida]|nr:topoisomerase II-associated protein PAT1 [Trichophaea hybrida]
MSFLGFDTSRTPAQRVHPQEARFGETPDNFAGLTSRTADANFDKGIDFEDTYDGLGDTLDETDDAFNEDTFGGASSTDQDFDFAGATAKVADVIHEEQVVYTRSNTKRQPIQSSVSPKDNKSIPAVSESSRLPALVPDMSLWGTSPNPSQESPHNEPLHSFIASPLPGKKFMSLEEVEAQILAMSPQTPPQPSVHNYRTLGSPNQLVMHHLQPQPLQHTSSPMDVRGFPQQLSQHVQQIMQHNQLTQCLQPFNQDRISSHLLPLPQQRIPQRDSEPIPLQARNQYGMTTHIPVQSLQSMTEADRLKFLEEESKRLKRNHKIAQLARFNGLMTPQDKNFIQRIQLQQLVSINNTDDNANEDFYYIVHSAIRARSNPQQPLSQLAQTYLFHNHLQRMEQQVARAVAAAKARPKASQLVLEGSLGKISFSNVKAPRPMLNIKKSDTGVEQTKKSSLVDRKSLLRAIESVYDALLELEIHQRDRSKLPPLQPGQPPLEAHTEWSKIRDQLAHKLYSETKINEPIDPSSRSAHPFIAILSFSKMKRAMPRIFRYLDPEQRVTVLTMIVVHLDILDVVKHGIYHPDETQLPSAHREEIDAFANHVLPPLLSYMYEASISVVIGLLAIMLDRVDIRTSSQMDDNDLHDWQVIYDRLFDTLNGRWTDCFPPSGNFMAVGANMQQQQTLVASVKERVLENVQASKILPAEIGSNGLDVDLLG